VRFFVRIVVLLVGLAAAAAGLVATAAAGVCENSCPSEGAKVVYNVVLVVGIAVVIGAVISIWRLLRR